MKKRSMFLLPIMAALFGPCAALRIFGRNPFFTKKQVIAVLSIFLLSVALFASHALAEDEEEDDQEWPVTTTRLAAKYGVLSHSGSTEVSGKQARGDAETPIILLEVGKRHTYESQYYWGWGVEIGGTGSTTERWTAGGSMSQANALGITGPLGVGIFLPQVEGGIAFSSEEGTLGGRAHLALGYDVQTFKRTNFYDPATAKTTGVPSYESLTLPRVGVGLAGEWGGESWKLFASAQYDVIIAGQVTNSLVDRTADTRGARLTGSLGVSVPISDYRVDAGVQFRSLSLDGSGGAGFGNTIYISPNSKTEVIAYFVGIEF